MCSKFTKLSLANERTKVYLRDKVILTLQNPSLIGAISFFRYELQHNWGVENYSVKQGVGNLQSMLANFTPLALVSTRKVFFPLFLTSAKQFNYKMSKYTEEYLKNKLIEKLGATHVVSCQWKRHQTLFVLISWQKLRKFVQLHRKTFIENNCCLSAIRVKSIRDVECKVLQVFDVD